MDFHDAFPEAYVVYPDGLTGNPGVTDPQDTEVIEIACMPNNVDFVSL